MREIPIEPSKAHVTCHECVHMDSQDCPHIMAQLKPIGYGGFEISRYQTTKISLCEEFEVGRPL